MNNSLKIIQDMTPDQFELLTPEAKDAYVQSMQKPHPDMYRNNLGLAIVSVVIIIIVFL